MLGSGPLAFMRLAVADVVELSRRHAALLVSCTVLLAVVSGIYTARHISIDTDEQKLISPNVPWRRTAAVFDREFPQLRDLLAVVVDAQTPDQAADAASTLTARLRAQPSLFSDVRQPDASLFFMRNGLLFLPRDQVQKFADDMISAQPLLGMLAADPNLRGVFGALDLMAQGAIRGDIGRSVIDPPLGAVERATRAALAGRRDPLSWQTLLGGRKPDPRELRRFILARPVLDYKAVEPGHRAVVAVRAAARAEGLESSGGVRVRVTGPVALSDDQFSALSEGAGFSTALSVGLLCFWLGLGLRSFRTVSAVLVTLIIGLVGCTAAAVWLIGPFNPISVAFAPLFVGIAIDFGIQFSVRYAAEVPRSATAGDALRQTALAIGGPLVVAAGATSVGFLSFVPTDYTGVSDLGLIAGLGMVLALALNLTLLPALLTLFGAARARYSVRFSWGGAADLFIARRRAPILVAAAVLGAGAVAALPRLSFDFNPVHLQNQASESVATLDDLMGDSLTTPYTVNILTPSPAAADALSRRLSGLPEVAQVLDVRSFVPDDQEAKLDILADARSLLGPTLNPAGPRPTSSAEETLASIARCAGRLRTLAGSGDAAAARLAAQLDAVLARGRGALPALEVNLSDGAGRRLDELRLALQAAPVSLETLPPDITGDWIGRDGRWRIEVHPKGDSRNNEVLRRFCESVRRLAPDATGTPVAIQESARTVTGAFASAGLIAICAIVVLLFLVLRRPSDVSTVLAPLLLAGVLTLATGVVVGLPLNFANIITLPLLLGIGVAFDIYFVMRWRAGEEGLLRSSTAKAVLFSALTTGTAFGSLALSRSPGMADMGKLLSLALFFTLVCTFFVLPALLGPAAASPKDGGKT
jgi:hopanoid biosynthesis associated RND transporter like protein HpnN